MTTATYPEVAPSVRGRIQALDGLRAFAVGLVIAFHLWPETVPGGFVGVDVFFVLSGFLITTRLTVELQTTGRIDLPAFWLRRARRLVPALLLVVLGSAAAASLVSRDLLVDIDRQVFGAFTFSTNWVEVWAGTDYFANAESQLLNPLWSLAVEEQFYLLWPAAFTLLAVRRVSRQRSAGISLILAGVSAVLMATLLTSSYSPTRVYYGTDTHIFGLMIGVTLAYRMADPASLFHQPRWLSARAWLGPAALLLLLIVLTTLGSTARWTYQGGLLAASTLTALVVAALPGERTALVDLLDRKPMRWIGQRSYGIYLWHWPVLLIVRAALPARPPGAATDAQTALLALALTAAVSASSYRYVELPIHQNGFRATLAHWRHVVVADRRDRQPAADGGRGAGHATLRRFVAPVAFVTLVVLALAAVVTAPKISEAQRSVEEGQRMIAAQAANSSPSSTSTAASITPIASAGPINGSQTDASARLQPTDVEVQPDLTNPQTQVFQFDTTGPTEGDSTVADTGSDAPPATIDPAEPTAAPAATSLPTTAPVAMPTVPVPPAATAVPVVAQPPTSPPIDGTKVVGVGDSVLSGAAPAMYERFPGIDLVAAASRQWGDAPSMIDDLLAQGRLRETVVLNFGTNAGLVDDRRIQAARETFERIGPNHRIVVVTIVGISGWVPDSNANLIQLAAAHPNVTVVDWNAAVQNDPGLVGSDRTHPNLRGIAVYADLIANALR